MTVFKATLSCLSAGLLLLGAAPAQKMPREDVVEVPAIGDGLCVSNVFQSHMVIQRAKPVTVWGWAAPGEKVTVGFAGQSATATAADDRSWKLELPAMAANDRPQAMTVAGKNQSLTLEDILVGDVWVLGGQSNMEFDISKVNDGMLEIVSANFPEIRLLTVPQGKGFDSVASFERLHEWSSWSSRHFRKGDWEVCSPETVMQFSAIGYVFGRRLQTATDIPIGLIDVSVGGTTVETWTPEDVITGINGQETKDLMARWAEKIATYDPQADLEKQIAGYERQLKKLADQGKKAPEHLKKPDKPRPGPVADKNRPGNRYASMIKPLEGLAVSGAVFHQGYNNCFGGSAGARMYGQVFPHMITAWRAAFGDEKLPFCIVSLCTAGEPQTHENFAVPMHDVGALIRAAQYRTFRDFREAGDETIGFASSFDFRKSSYHPQIKIPVGERVAKWALAGKYELITGRDAEEYWLPPSIEEVERADGTIRLKMSTPISMKDNSESAMTGFAIAGKDRRFHPATIAYFTDGTVDSRNRPKFQKDILVLSSPWVPEPVHYRHAWARNPMTNLTNSRQIPVATQRSDDWILEETPVKFPLPPGADLQSMARQLKGKLRKELDLIDRERQILEAEATVAEMKEEFLADKMAWEESKGKEAEKIRAQHEAAKAEQSEGDQE